MISIGDEICEPGTHTRTVAHLIGERGRYEGGPGEGQLFQRGETNSTNDRKKGEVNYDVVDILQGINDASSVSHRLTRTAEVVYL